MARPRDGWALRGSGEVRKFRVLAVSAGFENGEGVLIDGGRGIECLEVLRAEVSVQLGDRGGRVRRGFAFPLVLELELGRGVVWKEVDIPALERRLADLASPPVELEVHRVALSLQCLAVDLGDDGAFGEVEGTDRQRALRGAGRRRR